MANPLLDIGNDNIIAISRKLEQSHLVYLQTDDSPLKLQQRKKLEGYIKEFLCLIPHGHKYVFHETADILHRSAQTMKDFSGYRACTAWSAISLYAANLLAQPWRKEYKTLRTFSGYYKYEVEANLIGAELMFELMGYKHVDLGVMHLEPPIDPDKVSNVSRDSIVAFVECQILKQIWEAVSKKFPISWLEVLRFRENHVCSPEQAIRALNQRFLEKMNQNHHSLNYCHAQPVMMNPGLPYDLTMNNYVPSYPNDYQYLENQNATPIYHINSNYDAHYAAYNCLPHSTKCAQTVVYVNPPIVSPCRVPTGRLIELDNPIPEKSYSGKPYSRDLEYDEVDTYNKAGHYDCALASNKMPKSYDSNNWDYVFQDLEKQGYKKNLGDRDDILQQSRHRSLDEKFQARTLERKKDKKSEEKSYKMSEPKVQMEFDMGSDYNEEPRRKSGNLKNISPGVIDVMESMKQLTVDGEIRNEEEEVQKWDCASCTYLNKPEKEICEMCNKSRHKGNEDVPLASGSKECPKCTLINEKDAQVCAVCDNSLKDSPTYI